MGKKLTGSTESIGGKQPVSVNLLRKPTSSGVTFEGKISIGNSVSNISSPDNNDISEKDSRRDRTPTTKSSRRRPILPLLRPKPSRYG